MPSRKITRGWDSSVHVVGRRPFGRRFPVKLMLPGSVMPSTGRRTSQDGSRRYFFGSSCPVGQITVSPAAMPRTSAIVSLGSEFRSSGQCSGSSTLGFDVAGATLGLGVDRLILGLEVASFSEDVHPVQATIDKTTMSVNPRCMLAEPFRDRMSSRRLRRGQAVCPDPARWANAVSSSPRASLPNSHAVGPPSRGLEAEEVDPADIGVLWLLVNGCFERRTDVNLRDEGASHSPVELRDAELSRMLPDPDDVAARVCPQPRPAAFSRVTCTRIHELNRANATPRCIYRPLVRKNRDSCAQPPSAVEGYLLPCHIHRDIGNNVAPCGCILRAEIHVVVESTVPPLTSYQKGIRRDTALRCLPIPDFLACIIPGRHRRLPVAMLGSRPKELSRTPLLPIEPGRAIERPASIRICRRRGLEEMNCTRPKRDDRQPDRPGSLPRSWSLHTSPRR